MMASASTESIRERAYRINMALRQHHLVEWTSGNASVRDPDRGLVAIKPSGVHYDQLSVGSMVVVDLEGRVVDGNLKPSDDTASHVAIYRARPNVNSVIHTHSTYASAWAAVGRPVPIVLTSMADVFGGEIPCGGFVPIGGTDIASEALRVCGDSPAVLMQNHGVFCFAESESIALRAAVMAEEVAKIVWLSLALGTPVQLPADFVAAQHDFYLNSYGQDADGADVRAADSRR